MKFFHLSDLHIGLKLLGRDLMEDQVYLLGRIAEAARREQPDAVVIAGDIYDKAVPSAEAVSAFDGFMAALSLALGMADEIQARSAAINLDIMFIDEGFGSLDERARDQAVRVLQRMAGGSKLIGIISHVTELKQEIDDQLVVSRDERGSHVQWRNI